ncbi:hypothetical protein AHAS_Ahas11G0269800 [Arachis hypogaea]
MTFIIIKIKNAIKEIPYISILDPLDKLIVETNASELGYEGILKQIPPNSSKEQIEDLFNKTFIIRTGCKAAPSVLKNDVKNLVSKQIFSRWQAILSCFDFTLCSVGRLPDGSGSDPG